MNSSHPSPKSNLSNKPNKPSEMNKTLLLIAMSTPALATMYMQDVNIWVVFMLLVITISQAFNLSSIRLQNSMQSTLNNAYSEIVDTLNANSKAQQDLYENQVMLRDKFDILKDNHDTNLQTFKQIDKDLRITEIRLEDLSVEIDELKPKKNVHVLQPYN